MNKAAVRRRMKWIATMYHRGDLDLSLEGYRYVQKSPSNFGYGYIMMIGDGVVWSANYNERGTLVDLSSRPMQENIVETVESREGRLSSLLVELRTNNEKTLDKRT